MPEIEYSARNGEFVFYLVLKGEIAIFTDQDNTCLRLLGPALPEHAYVAGPWLGESGIPKHQKLELVGVTGGHDTPAAHSDILIRLPNAKMRPDLARFEVTVPLPKAILPGATQDAEGMKVTIIQDDGSTTPISMPRRTCLAAILVYAWDGTHEPLLLDRASGRKWGCGGKIPAYRSLHICASGETSDEENLPEHAKRAFQEAAALLGINAVIDFGGGGVITPTNPPPGLSPFEVNLSYFETLELRSALGDILEGGPGKIPVITQIRFLGGNCGPVGG